MLVLFFLTISILFTSILLLTTSNRIYCILYLIYMYMCTSILFMYLGVSLLCMFYFLVYIGAVAVLFLFSVMILDLKGYMYERDYTIFISVFVILFILLIQSFFLSPYLNYDSYEYIINTNDMLRLLGILIYNQYSLVLLVLGLVLLVAMLGAIYLTNYQKGFFLRIQENNFDRNAYLFNTIIY